MTGTLVAVALVCANPGTTPTIDGDRVYTLSKQGKVLCLEAATG